MSLKGMRFTLDVDGQQPDAFAIVAFSFSQSYSSPFDLNVEVASKLFDKKANELLEKNATLTIWKGMNESICIFGVITSLTSMRIIDGRLFMPL